MDAPDEMVRSWDHCRKGRITGVEVGGDEEWVHVRLVGDHQVRWLSAENRMRQIQKGGEPDGEVMTLRRSLMVEVQVHP